MLEILTTSDCFQKDGKVLPKSRKGLGKRCMLGSVFRCDATAHVNPPWSGFEAVNVRYMPL